MIGIYALYWEQEDQIYVGQSINISNRWKEHKNLMSKKEANYKVQRMYDTYGLPEFMLLQECAPGSLDELEISYIREFNSVDKGLNISTGGTNAVGTNNFASKYSVIRILRVFSLLYNSTLSCREIAIKERVTTSFVSSIASSNRHMWLCHYYPLQYKAMVDSRDKDKSTEYPIIVDKNKIEYCITNIKAFCDSVPELNLIPSHLSAVIRGDRKSHKGFKLAEGSSPRAVNKFKGSLVGPNGELYSSITNITEFCKHNEYLKNNINARKGISRLVTKEALTYLGFKLQQEA